MPHLIKPRHLVYAGLCIMLVASFGRLIFDRNTDSPTQRAYDECRPCRLPDAEVDQLIEDCRRSKLSCEDQIKLFDSTFASGDDRCEPCLPCVEAVLDAAGKMGGGNDD